MDVEGDQRVHVTMLTVGDVKKEAYNPADITRDTMVCEAGSNRVESN